MPHALTFADDVRLLLDPDAAEVLARHVDALGRRARCAWCWSTVDDDRHEVVVFDPHAGHGHERREATLGVTHPSCRLSGVAPLDAERLERSLQPPTVRLGHRRVTPAAVLVLEMVGDLLVLHPDGRLSELPTSGMVACRLPSPTAADALDTHVPASPGWWVELTGSTLAVQGLVAAGQRQTYASVALPDPIGPSDADWLDVARAEGAVLLVGTALPVPGPDGAPPWTTVDDLTALAWGDPAVRAVSVPVRPGPGEGLRRNDRCACGSGAKYKACCGR